MDSEFEDRDEGEDACRLYVLMVCNVRDLNFHSNTYTIATLVDACPNSGPPYLNSGFHTLFH